MLWKHLPPQTRDLFVGWTDVSAAGLSFEGAFCARLAGTGAQAMTANQTAIFVNRANE